MLSNVELLRTDDGCSRSGGGLSRFTGRAHDCSNQKAMAQVWTARLEAFDAQSSLQLLLAVGSGAARLPRRFCQCMRRWVVFEVMLLAIFDMGGAVIQIAGHICSLGCAALNRLSKRSSRHRTKCVAIKISTDSHLCGDRKVTTCRDLSIGHITER